MSLRSACRLAPRVSAPWGGDASTCCRRFCGGQPARLFGRQLLLGRAAAPAAGVELRRRVSTKFSSSETEKKSPLTKLQAEELVLKLTEEEHKVLITAIQTFQSEKMRQEYKGGFFNHTYHVKFKN